jgi:hypothetical protein
MTRWAPIPGYEGAYEVSDAGEVRSLPGGHRSGRVLRPARKARAAAVDTYESQTGGTE